jgi:hypothetical protein
MLGTLPLLRALQHLEVASTDTNDAGLLALDHHTALAWLSIQDCQVPPSDCRMHKKSVASCLPTAMHAAWLVTSVFLQHQLWDLSPFGHLSGTRRRFQSGTVRHAQHQRAAVAETEQLLGAGR